MMYKHPFHLKSTFLAEGKKICHAFFGRQGGVSQGVYKSLNCGLGSKDNLAAVKENRDRVLHAIGCAKNSLATLKQKHSSDTVIVNSFWDYSNRPSADAIVTNEQNIVLGVLTADCAPILFADSTANIIGAAHAGWKGAKAGIISSVLLSMEKLGAKRENIVAAIGPTIAKSSYEVGPEFHDTFVTEDKKNQTHFSPIKSNGKFFFDLPAFICSTLNHLGITKVENTGINTYNEKKRFYSCRRSTHEGKSDYGRNMSVIAIIDSNTDA